MDYVPLATMLATGQLAEADQVRIMTLCLSSTATTTSVVIVRTAVVVVVVVVVVVRICLGREREKA
jgi:hypothetical protein